MKTILILVISILPFGMSAQINHIDYKVDCDVAYRMAIDDSDYSKCLGQLSKVNKKYGKLYCEEYILMAYCYKKMGKETKSAKCLRSAWSNYGFDMVCIDQIPQLNLTGINQGYGKKQKRIVQQGYDNFPKLNRINTDSLKIVFEKMEERDQGPRMKFYQDSVVDTIALNREMHLVDSLNLLEFRDIIYKVGYPGEWILPLNVSRVFVLLIHSSYNQAFFYEMKPIFLQEVIAGRMPPSHYAIWLDRHYSVADLPQSYGMLAVPENFNLSEKQKQEIIAERLKIGLIKNCPIPTQLLMFE